MNLSKDNVHQIVTQIAALIHQNINFIGTDGIIIDSTDPARIGTVHGGALHIIQNNLKDLVIERNDEYEGAVNGINLPILLNNEIVGVIGITGQSQVVSNYGQIVKRMTEIMLAENYRKDQEMIYQKAHDSFLEEYIFGRLSDTMTEQSARQAELLQIDVSRFRRLAVVEINLKGKEVEEKEQLVQIGQTVINLLHNRLQAESYQSGLKVISLLPEYTDPELLQAMADLQEVIERKYGFSLQAGISSPGCQTPRDAYIRAETALMTASRQKKSVCVYDELDPLHLLMQIPDKNEKKAFIRQLFTDDLMPDLDEWMQFLRIYIAENGSLTAVAQKLNLHKNSVQYRLRKLAETTGQDPRSYHALFLYQLALEFYDEMRLESSR